eukprot:15458050-Alexandrium_andersonii.AAC.1
MGAAQEAHRAAASRAVGGLKLAGLDKRRNAPTDALAPTGLGQDREVAEGPPPSLGARQARDAGCGLAGEPPA